MINISPTFSQIDNAPVVSAQGRQAFCPGSSINIVTDFSITDADDTTIESFFIQISSGYQFSFDQLSLTNHPTIKGLWSGTEGKLTLSSKITGTEMLLTDLEDAVKKVVFTTTSNNITSEKKFSLTFDNANYLPLTDHFYEFISVPNITWKDAKVAAESKTYYGRKGYLATLTSAEEASFAGKQSGEPGWIGGSDEETEGVWKWVTGPEAGTIFWNGTVNGTSPNYANWNVNEPNNLGEEHYAHITDVTIGTPGAWNDLPNEGGSGKYIPKGYIVEYGIPTDPPLKIVASTRIYIPQITATTTETVCEFGVVNLSATPSEGTIIWYESQTSNTPLFTGNNYTTPIINSTTSYFATVSVNGCLTNKRVEVIATVTQRPTITNTTDDLICSGSANLSATPSAGVVKWYDSLTSTTSIFTGNNFQTPAITSSKTYYVEAEISNCNSSTRVAVNAIVNNTIPEFDLEKPNYFLCDDVGSVTIKTINHLDNYRYVWKKNGDLISGNASNISVKESALYSVKAISDAGCESIEKFISVIDSGKATITFNDIELIDDSDNNSIKVINDNLGKGEYEFSLDDEFGTYKDAGFFDKIETGLHTLFIRDKNGCKTTPYQFSILAYPKYFTPNGDGENDVWNIDGFNNTSFSVAKIYIYNRYGVLIYQKDTSSNGWDGRYQGKLLPSSTYWFRILLTDINNKIIEKKGKISLIRK